MNYDVSSRGVTNVGSMSAGVSLCGECSPFKVPTQEVAFTPLDVPRPYHWRRIVAVQTQGPIRVGMEGVCTAELPEDDVFAVWMDEPIHDGTGNEFNWLKMNYEGRHMFAVIPGEPPVDQSTFTLKWR